jgi:hypothetical protein
MVALLRWLRASWVFVLDLVYGARTLYLTVVTFGAWGRMGRFTLHQADVTDLTRKDLDRLEYRLDEFMRSIEQQGIVTIPAHIDAPRLTTFGTGLDEIEEAERMKESLEAYRREQEEAAKVPSPPPLEAAGDSP